MPMLTFCTTAPRLNFFQVAIISLFLSNCTQPNPSSVAGHKILSQNLPAQVQPEVAIDTINLETSTIQSGTFNAPTSLLPPNDATRTLVETKTKPVTEDSQNVGPKIVVQEQRPSNSEANKAIPLVSSLPAAPTPRQPQKMAEMVTAVSSSEVSLRKVGELNRIPLHSDPKVPATLDVSQKRKKHDVLGEKDRLLGMISEVTQISAAELSKVARLSPRQKQEMQQACQKSTLLQSMPPEFCSCDLGEFGEQVCQLSSQN